MTTDPNELLEDEGALPELSGETEPTEVVEHPESADTETSEEYGAKVQKRINKEVARRKAAETRQREADERSAAMEARLIRLEEETSRRYAQLDETSHRTEEEKLKARYDAARIRHRKAVEEVDPAAQDEALAEILEARLQLAQRSAQAPAQKQSPPAPVQSQQPLPRGTREWLSDNTWFSDPKFAPRAQLASTLDSVLQSEGYSPHDPDMYEELDRRLQAAMPVKKGSRAKGNGGGALVGASQDGGGGDVPQGKRITRDDLVAMEKYGFNPESKADRAKWLKYKED